jgi:hypothetical protein
MFGISLIELIILGLVVALVAAVISGISKRRQ